MHYIIQDNLNKYYHISIMTSVIQDIQFIRSLRKDIRDIKLPGNILASIEHIHSCIKGGTDLTGWKKVEWRNGTSGGGGGSSNTGNNRHSSHNSIHKGPLRGDNGGSSFFMGRSSNSENNKYTFNGRNRQPQYNRHNNDTSSLSSSIPLTDGNNIKPTQTSHVSNNTTCESFKNMSHKYVSRFKKSSEKVEDTILNTIVLGKLNKFSEKNYGEIKEFITHIIDSGQTDMIKCFMKLVFQKAASEEIFCPLYAKLLSELSSRYPVLLTEMKNLYSEYMEIFDEVQETNAENYNEICQRNVEKKYRRGYSQFLAELIKYNIIDNEPFMMTVDKIIKQVENNIQNNESIKLNEEYADCLMKIMKAIQIEDNELDSSDENNIEIIQNTFKLRYSERIKPFTLRNNTGISNKARFTFLDIYEAIQKF
jgi:hypothetical protein